MEHPKTWTRLDQQMAVWSSRLTDDVRVAPEQAKKLATCIAADVRFLPAQAKSDLASASPVSIRDRLEEVISFQGWMEEVRGSRLTPFTVRSQVVIQNYICFVYFPESCFRVLSKALPSNSAGKRCAKFLCSDRIRALRNAIAHANWTYRRDFMAITYWARKGSEPTEPLAQFSVEQEELSFWQALSRCTAYSVFSNH
jgi:hypothetical protein